MKTPIVAVLLVLGAMRLSAQNVGSASTIAPGPSAAPSKDTPYAVVQKDANSRVWEQTTYEPGPSGEALPHLHRYTEIATGLNYQKDGQWVESKEEIDILPTGGAAATQGQHQVYFPGDIYNGEIRMVTPDGKVMSSRPLGLSYDDGAKTVLISELKESVGVLVGSNQVIYPDAFTDFKADLRYTYTKNGFEQDIILREAPRTPESYGLNAAAARLQMLTEFFSSPQPAIISSVLPSQAGLALTDHTLNFGGTEMIRGKAFLSGIDTSDRPVLVSKQWLLLDGRRFLVEEVPVDAIVNGLAALPQTAMNSNAGKTPHVASRRLPLPPQRLVKKGSSKAMLLAKNEFPAGGFVLDYQTVNGSLTNYTFRGDMTYYISGALGLYGTNTFEGGTVLKYTYGASINIAAGCGINWLGVPYHPVILTARDDNSVGEAISGSTGNPIGYYASYALSFNNAGPLTLSNFRISYATNAIGDYQTDLTLYDGQFINDQFGVEGIYYANKLRNILMANVLNNFTSTFSSLDSQNSTFSGSAWLNQSTFSASMSFENCVFANVTNLISGSSTTLTGTNNGFYKAIEFGIGAVTNTFNPFQTVGAGSYYLANGCVFTNAGTTNIDPVLLAVLGKKTIYPPIVYTGGTFSAVSNFGPCVLRDTNSSLALGYHYDPLDYCFGGVTVNANLTFAAGTAVGYFETVSGNGYGIALGNHVTNTFNGTLVSPCVFARYSSVQEGNGNWTLKGFLAGISTVGSASYYAQINANFTHCYALNWDPNHFRDYYAQLNVYANNCEFYGGGLGGYWLGTFMTNCLFDRTVYIGSQEKSAGLFWRNCTMHGGNVFALHSTDPYWRVWIENCAFDGSTITMDDNASGNTNITYCDYNGFLNGAQRLIVNGAHDVVTNTFTWQNGPLGPWYQPTNSPLINTGSITADLVGLYHFTTLTNEVKETNSTVDIGYHYVAVDNNGNALDTDGDGLPDYLEDPNGNGTVDSGEDDWRKADLGIWISRPSGLVATP